MIRKKNSNIIFNNNIINSNININQNNNYDNKCYIGCFPNFFNQYNNIVNYNGCKLNNTIQIDVNNINSFFNNNNFESKKGIKNIISHLTPINQELIEKYYIFLQNQKNQEKALFNNFNEINSNCINNYINIPKIPINSNLLFLSNNMSQNNSIINHLKNLQLKNAKNGNYNNLINNTNNSNLLKSQRGDINNNFKIQNNKIKENEEIILNKMTGKRKKKYNKNMNLFPNDGSNNAICFNSLNNNYQLSKKADNNFNQQKNGYSNKRKIFNPIPKSEMEKNIISLIDILQCKDTRTTLMIKNIPNKYTISLFLDEINDYFKGTYDIFYLPIDYVNKCNLGFAFINYVEPLHIILFSEL